MYRIVTTALSRVLGSPPYIILFLSDACWLRCAHCWFHDDWKREHLSGAVLSLEELSRIADSIPRIAFLSLTGGEAFLRPDLVKIAEAFALKTRLGRYQIPTSGYDPRRVVETTRELLDRIPEIPLRVDVSLDGLESTHDRIRGRRRAFANAVRTLRELNRLRRHYRHLDVGVITTVSRANQDEVDDIGALVERIHPDGEWMVNLVRGAPRESTVGDASPASYECAQRFIARRIAAGRYRGHSGHPSAKWISAKNATRRKIISKIIRGEDYEAGCAAGSLGGVVFSDGQVYPCEMLDVCLGNLRDYDYDLPRLWNSPRADEARCWIQHANCTCTQECFLSVSLLIQPQHWPDIVKERIKLSRAERRDKRRSRRQNGSG